MRENVLRSLDKTPESDPLEKTKKDARIILFVYVVLIAFGIGTGYVLSRKTASSKSAAQSGVPLQGSKVVGVADASTFKDCATGKLEKGGIDGEGTHKLIRDGGPSKTAYLISSVIDLDQFVDQNVKVCGETFAAKKVSWLMDIGRLEVQ